LAIVILFAFLLTHCWLQRIPVLSSASTPEVFHSPASASDWDHPSVISPLLACLNRFLIRWCLHL